MPHPTMNTALADERRRLSRLRNKLVLVDAKQADERADLVRRIAEQERVVADLEAATSDD